MRWSHKTSQHLITGTQSAGVNKSAPRVNYYEIPSFPPTLLTSETVVHSSQLAEVELSFLSWLQVGMEHTHKVRPHPLPQLRLDLHTSLKDVTTEVHDVVRGKGLAREVGSNIKEEKLTL